MRAFKMNEISAVDRPAQAHAKVVLMKRDFSASERRHDAGTGAAMPDGSFPIENAEDLSNARRLAGKAKDPAAARAHIERRAKALGLAKIVELHLAGASIEEMEKAIEAFNPTETVMTEDDVKKAVDAAVKPIADKLAESENALAVAKIDLIKANMTEDERAYYDKAAEPDKDDFAGMSAEDRKKKMKKIIDDAIPPEIRKQLEETADLKKRLADLEDDRAVAAYAKRAADIGIDGHGETLRKAIRGDAEAITKLESLLKGLAEQVRTGKIFAEFGSNQSGSGATAADELNAAAAVYREGQIKIGKKCTQEQAFTHVYTDSAYVELKKRYDAEEVKKRHAA
jgi:hypothetical protein